MIFSIFQIQDIQKKNLQDKHKDIKLRIFQNFEIYIVIFRSSDRRTNVDRNNWERNLTNLDLFPITNTLEKIICTSIEKKEAVIAKFFKLAIVYNYKFFDHIRTLTGLLLIDMRSFCSQMNARVSLDS